SADVRYTLRIKRCKALSPGINRGLRHTQDIPRVHIQRARSRCATHNVRVLRQLVNRERVGLFATLLPEYMTIADMNGCTSAKVWQCVVDPPVTSKRGAKQAEERLILVDG